MNPPITLDLFCKVIDNFGDAGFCLRLARHWQSTIGPVRLFIDLPETLADMMEPHDHQLNIQTWDDRLILTYTADMVIEAFGCNLPDTVTSLMTSRPVAPVWIDLEYLSAEDWVKDFHAIPSTHPATGLRKTVFFPGFSQQTGGLIQEKDLESTCGAFKNDFSAQNIWRKRFYLPEKDKNCLDLSLFCYPSAPLNDFLSSVSGFSCPVRVFQPQKRDNIAIETKGNLTLYKTPFLTQKNYDNLLWTCDLNFVRGEDSFVRAQLAGVPMIWNIYVQAENAHLIKLHAFLKLYGSTFDTDTRDLLASAHNLWNEGGRNQQDIWHQLLDSLPVLTAGARRWAEGLAAQDDLATRLLQFYKNQRD